MDPNDYKFVQKTVTLNLIQQKQLQECLKIQENLNKQGRNISISQILVQKQYLSKEQAYKVYQIIHRESTEHGVSKTKTHNPAETKTGNTTGIKTRNAADTRAEHSGDHNRPQQQIFANRYQVMQEIGAGGMGKVYLVYDLQLKRQAALKTLLNISNEVILKRFLREAEAAAALKHPNIVQVYGVFFQEKIPYMLMQYIKGSSLGDCLHHNWLSWENKLEVALKVAHALDFAHKQGILHRDLKPDNIMIAEDRTPYLMDFGLAKITQVSDKSLTRTGQLLGTPAYMSPEQAQGESRKLDARSDIYSFGVILYELFTNTGMVNGETVGQILAAVIHKTPTPMSKINPEIPKEIETICFKALAKNKEQRYQSMEDLCSDFERFLQGEKIQAKNPFSPAILYRKYALISALLLVVVFATYYFTQKIFARRSLQENALQITKKNTAEALLREAQVLLERNLFYEAQSQLSQAFSLAEQQKNMSLQQQVQHQQLLAANALNDYETVVSIYYKLPLSLQNERELILATAIAQHHLLHLENAELLLVKILNQTDAVDLVQIRARYYYGKNFYERKLYSKALSIFERVLDDPKHLQVVDSDLCKLHLGICHFHLENFQKAIDLLQKVRKTLPDMLEANEFLARAYLRTKSNLPLAEQYLQICIAQQSNNSQYYTWLAQAFFLQQQPKEAAIAAQRAIEIDPYNFVAREYLIQANVDNILEATSPHNITTDVVFVLRFFQPEIPDLFRDNVLQWLKKSQDNYHQWQILQQRKLDSPQRFIQVLVDTDSDAAHQSAVQALLAVRYHPQLQNLFLETIQKNPQKSDYLQRVWKGIQAIKHREQRELLIYEMTQFYLQKDLAIRKKLQQKRLEIIDTLRDVQENIEVRYLAAKTLFWLLETPVIDEFSKNSEKTLAALCICILKEHGIYAEDSLLSEMLQQPDTIDFLKNLAVLYGSHYQHEELLLPLLDSKDIKIRLYTANNIIQHRYRTPNLLRLAKNVLLELMRHSDPKWRQYAHYCFWNTLETKSIPAQYIQFFRAGLRDPDAAVCLTTLQFSYRFYMHVLIPDLQLLLRAENPEVIRFLAIIMVSWYQPKFTGFANIYDNPQEPTWLRFAALFHHVFSMPFHKNTGQNMANLLQFFSTVPQELPKFSRDPNQHLYVLIVYLLSIFQIELPEQTSLHADPKVRSSLMMSLGAPSFFGKGLGNIPVFNSVFRGMSTKAKLQIVESLLQDRNLSIRKAAHIVYMIVANETQRKKMFQKYLHSRDADIRQAVALGSYLIVYNENLEALQLSSKLYLNIDGFFADYAAQILKTSEQQRKYYMEKVSWAIALDEQATFYYVRAILHRVNGDKNKALDDATKAVKLQPEVPAHLVELAVCQWNMQKYSECNQTLLGVLKLCYNTDILWQYREILEPMLSLSAFEKILQHDLLHYKHYTVMLQLARFYAINNNKELALCYLKSCGQNAKLTQRVVRLYREFHILLDDPWILSLPR